LASLPSSETFISHTSNALKEDAVEVSSNSFTLSVPALSTTAVLFPSTGVYGIGENRGFDEIKIFPNPTSGILYVNTSPNNQEPLELTVYDQAGCNILSFKRFSESNTPIALNLSALADGFYFLSVSNSRGRSTSSFTVHR
jgi:hypothetical protein